MDLDGTAYLAIESENIVLTDGAGTTEIYVDGVQGTTITTGWHHILVSNVPGIAVTQLLLAKVATDYYDGVLDDVRLYDRALTDLEITTLAANSACP
jgi:hypothetical protein